MKKYIVILVVILISSCVPSIHPLYHAEDLIFDDRLVGSFLSFEGNDTTIWKFEKMKQSRTGYNLTISENGVPAAFEAMLLELDGQTFLDLFPHTKMVYTETVETDHTWESIHYIPVHTFSRISFNNDNLVIELFDPDFISDLLEQKRIRISHEETGNTFVLTASTDELQKFVLKFGREKEAYTEPGVYFRL